jgi:hypothetical protein
MEEVQGGSYHNNHLGSSLGGFGNTPNNIPAQAYSVTFSEPRALLQKNEPKVEIKPDLSQKIREPSIFIEEQHP